MRKPPLFVYLVSLLCLASLLCSASAQAQAKEPGTTLRGQVTDPSGAVIPKAAVTVSASAGFSSSVECNSAGQYVVRGLLPGRYTISVQAAGFAAFSVPLAVAPGVASQRLDVSLSIDVQQQQVEVSGDQPAVDVSPDANASAVVLSGKDLDALSDDPDELQTELTALAGPSAGPNGGQIYIDGFTAGQLPPKSSIREIRINQNPFSAEYDKPGYGRIEIFTKPGTDKLHGSAFLNANTSALNTRNPFASNQQPYHTVQYNGNVSGALSKRASFFFNVDRRDIQDNSIVNAFILDPSAASPATANVLPFNEAVPYPQTRTNIGPRIDYQLTPKQTLIFRYQFEQTNRSNDGLGSNPLVLPSQAYNTHNTEHTVQLSDSQVYGARLVNDTRFQYLHQNSSQVAQQNTPTVIVLGAFQGGGSPQGDIRDTQDHYEFQDYASLALSNHYIRFGTRLRDVNDSNYSSSNFNGSSTYASLADYQHNLPSQFKITTGVPRQTANVFDAGLYAEDDWKIRPNLTLSYGLRYETQNIIHDHSDFGPRVTVAYGVGGGKTPPRTVLRAGYGLFYDRFAENLVLTADRFNIHNAPGQGQVQTITANPNGPTGSGGSSAAAGTRLPTLYQIEPGLHAPYSIQTGFGIERQVGKNVTASATYLYSRGLHQLLTRNINAPLPGAGMRPLPIDKNLYEFDALGLYKEQQIFLSLNARYGRKFSFTGFYVYSRANSDTSGATYNPSNQYNIKADYGRQGFDIRNRVFSVLNYSAPYGIRFSPFLIASSGAPFNIQVGQDLNGDSFFNDRPGFGDELHTKYGNFNPRPLPGQATIPVNYGNGPVLFSMNMRLAKTFGIGPKVGEGQGASTGGGPGGGGGRGRGAPGLGLGGGAGRGNPFGGDTRIDRRYSLTFSAFARNLFNVVNLAPPNGTIGSPLFGVSNQLATGFFSQGSAVRRIDVQAIFNF